ncbi:hypothetical protein JTE90_006228 [Oedothorax gibbosus]|uniref:Uncharacterized protein n=1 Tax=Oedothorax gibbosus TaxID=931172 RepID=A0AAV6VV78_9ARAC|nr:hypothetical protein JTE90_006228 [Oedothorax gibbosus]
MASHKDKPAEEKNDSQSEDNESNKNFQSLQSGEKTESKGIIADSTTKSIGIDEVQLRQQAQVSSISSEDQVSRMLYRLKKRRLNDKRECSLEGNWTLICSREINDSGTSQADEILKYILELYETRKDLFSRAPYFFKMDGGKLVVCCCTQDYEDKSHVLKVVKAIRDIVDYPYVMYYNRKLMDKINSCYMHTPNDEFYISVNERIKRPMEASKDKFTENNDGSMIADEVAENYVLKLDDLEIEDPKMSDENPVSGSSFKPKYSEDNCSFRRSTHKRQNRTFDNETSLDGNWTLICSTEVDSCGKSQADQISAAIQELHESRADLFAKLPYYHKKRDGAFAICCYTPDYKDKDFALEVAKAIREVVDYPYLMYYHKRKAISLSNNEILPSQVTDHPYIYLQDDDFQVDESMQDGGKWMLFINRDFQKLDHYWTCLKTLFNEGTLVGLKASTASNPDSGVINCYTGDSGNWVEVKKAAVAIRDVIDYPFIMYYKTNEASAQGQYREKGYKLISRYMFTIKGGFYEKDKYGRWEWI